MIPEGATELLGLPAERMDELLGRVVKRCSWPEPRLLRFEKSISGVEAGTVIFDNGDVIFGYPKIRRAMMLESAIRRHFFGRVVAEEKMNGYNIRVASINGQIISLTRGGFICPYSTEVAREQISRELFEDHPELVLCGEMVGPDNPYVPKNIYPTSSVQIYLFDIAQKGNRTMQGVYRTCELAEEYGITRAPVLGEFDSREAFLKVLEIVKNLGREGREGVVLKDPRNEVSPIKYTSSESTCSDLQFAFKYYYDYAQDFFFSRVVREGFQSVEWRDSDEEFGLRSQRLGESILAPMVETIKRSMAEEQIVQHIQIRVKNLHTAWAFEQHLRRMGVRAIFERPVPCNGKYLVGITRPVMSTNDKTRSVIEGELW
jgi:putative ATP-dependent DNA ligase